MPEYTDTFIIKRGIKPGTVRPWDWGVNGHITGPFDWIGTESI